MKSKNNWWHFKGRLALHIPYRDHIETDEIKMLFQIDAAEVEFTVF